MQGKRDIFLKKMPGGFKNIKPEDGKQFTSDNQPANRGRKPGSRAWRDVLSDMMPEDGYLAFDNVEVIDPTTGKRTGEVVPKVRVKMATQEMIVLAAIKKAMKGDMRAITAIWDRMDGKPDQKLSGNINMKSDISELTDDQLRERLENIRSGHK